MLHWRQKSHFLKEDRMSEQTTRFAPPAAVSAAAHIKSLAQYKAMYEESIKDPDGFWLRMATDLIDWYKAPTKGRYYKWDTSERIIEHRFFEDGKLNLSYNCIDRHLKTWRKNKAAIVWQGEPEDDVRVLTYQDLHREVSKFANVLKSKGV